MIIELFIWAPKSIEEIRYSRNLDLLIILVQIVCLGLLTCLNNSSSELYGDHRMTVERLLSQSSILVRKSTDGFTPFDESW